MDPSRNASAVDIRAIFPSLRCRPPAVFQDTIWLGGEHDGYRLCTLNDYPKCRENRPCLYKPTSASDRFLDLAASYQAQLSFGLIEAVVGEKFAEVQLLRPRNGDHVISSDGFRQIILSWQRRILALEDDRDTRRQWMARADTALKQAMSLLLMILMPLNNPFFRARLHIDTVGRIFQMLAAIAETLAFTKQLLRVQATTQNLKYSFVNMTFDAYQRDMISIGWCPFTVQLMAAEVCRTAYASTVRPFIRGDLGKKGHSACDKGGCIVNNINCATYVVQHTSPTCGCDPKGPPLEDVVDALQ
ncbi:hypothetical protein WOLCODRAFT_145261 [Wolfiporia cocos MD-104 SS10]|uniref:Uncharacterized protein n=1 Tax=Wolfiporia cocos (strain MD-104) TaxID=742152 RepID=A0A2H3K7A7_WOLCO|nr:hypothetical protein WOLCODRAFT_145261 [Wolfiporia cocos MD-104 SS10]